ncbi:hypothetical protein BS50DRAFT_410396 [Corynespora cassiicola Philippines]|uniref:EH domain-containing protein n=1 Tax=Corynespora cassiicola Philippines TaxID=1448308 RepID=A0A2T2NLC9_CORCC|nr:hypothetical protein BS50DRAFT_410396 [Corynespora cassiicola Philippines]
MSSATSARNTAKVPQPTGDTQFNVRDAALRGASSAFAKPPVKPKPQVNTYTGGNNGALLAATKVGTGTPRAATPAADASPLRRDWTGGSARELGLRPNHSPMQPPSNSSSSTLGVPDDYLSDRGSSPSNIAAKLAAARFSPMKPLPQATVAPVVSERDPNEADVLPPAGSVGNVLSRLDSQKPVKRPPKPKRRGSVESQSIASSQRTPIDKPTDDTPIPPTTSLVKQFEQNRPKTPTKQIAEPLVISQKAPPPLRSPKPLRKIKPPPEPEDELVLARKKTKTPPPVKPKPKPPVESMQSTEGTKDQASFNNLRRDSLGHPPIRKKPSDLALIKTPTRPVPPPKRGTRQSRPKSDDLVRSTSRSTSFQRRMSSSMRSEDVPSSPASFVSAQEEQEQPEREEREEKPKPSLPPPRRSGKAKTEGATSETRPKVASPLPPRPQTPSNKLASPLQVPERFTPRPASAMGSSPPSGILYHSNYQRDSAKAISKHMTGDSLSSAMVGAALASSRNASPAPSSTATPPIPIRKHHHHHHHSPFHRSPSPPKSSPKPSGKLLTTLRKEPSSSSDEDENEKYKRKGTRIMGMGRKHPNKHHEGTRKRWRDQITERERKRYEGVWAANKGLYILPSQASKSPSQSPPDDESSLDVCNLVTREIWLRSRLSEDVLEEVWDLVDSRGIGRLKREEFVVGLWLIDQRLKGRKLPVKVSEHVWGSVRGAGVKVKVKP